ncbi:MAG: D-glycero-beta-D-manno-heptose 1-phosphate adenylyltransferase [Candidatus Firestonebacteria bacterium]|nr:D-glycero-beta-D-manno-heptose 1-phosphate adenylyltransferase [Candidatus Firestonebacteria bacterium]
MVDWQEAAVRVARWTEVGRKVVFTNGCFDLLHQGHARYLAAARRLGDALVVGLNSDASVRRLKGEKRPLLPEDERAELIASLECVDLVVIFGEDDPGALIATLKPFYLVKGADWPKEKVIGRETVLALGGDVVSMPLVEGRSTTQVIEEILKKYR